MYLHLDHQLLLIDVKTAFLESSLDETLFLHLPKGLEEFKLQKTKGLFGRLNKAIYGLNQASRQFYRRLRTYLETLGSKQATLNPASSPTPPVPSTSLSTSTIFSPWENRPT